MKKILCLVSIAILFISINCLASEIVIFPTDAKTEIKLDINANNYTAYYQWIDYKKIDYDKLLKYNKEKEEIEKNIIKLKEEKEKQENLLTTKNNELTTINTNISNTNTNITQTNTNLNQAKTSKTNTENQISSINNTISSKNNELSSKQNDLKEYNENLEKVQSVIESKINDLNYGWNTFYREYHRKESEMMNRIFENNYGYPTEQYLVSPVEIEYGNIYNPHNKQYEMFNKYSLLIENLITNTVHVEEESGWIEILEHLYDVGEIIKMKEDEKSNINSSIASVQSQISTLQTEITSLQDQKTTLTHNLTNINNNITKYQNDLKSLNTQLNNYTITKNEIESMIKSANEKIANYNSSITEYNEEISRINSYIKAEEEKNNFVESEWISLTNETINNLPNEGTKVLWIKIVNDGNQKYYNKTYDFNIKNDEIIATESKLEVETVEEINKKIEEMISSNNVKNDNVLVNPKTGISISYIFVIIGLSIGILIIIYTKYKQKIFNI